MLAALRRQGLNQSQIARSLDRDRSMVCRELRRNSTRADGRYRASTAQERTNARRSRRNQRQGQRLYWRKIVKPCEQNQCQRLLDSLGRSTKRKFCRINCLCMLAS